MLQKHFHTVCLDRAAELRILAMIAVNETWRRETLQLARLWVGKSRAYRIHASARRA